MIMGKSGSGKTTLLNILGFLDKFDGGDYYFNDENVSKLNENQRSVFRNKNIGFIFQQFNLIETLNIYQNIELPLIYNKISSKKEKKAIIEASLSSVGLLDKINQFPLQLSGGQQQRIAIARALVNNPQIIFADEPTGALDSETSEEIMKLLKKLNNNRKTIIMVTHDQDLTKYLSLIHIFHLHLLLILFYVHQPTSYPLIFPQIYQILPYILDILLVHYPLHIYSHILYIQIFSYLLLLYLYLFNYLLYFHY